MLSSPIVVVMACELRIPKNKSRVYTAKSTHVDPEFALGCHLTPKLPQPLILVAEFHFENCSSALSPSSLYHHLMCITRKQTLRSLSLSCPKGLAGWGPANPSLGMTPTIKYYSTAFIDYIL